MSLQTRILQCTIAITAILLSGCAEKIPSCGDEPAKTVLTQIISDAITPDSDLLKKDIRNNLKLSVTEPVVKEKKEKLPSFSCEARINYVYGKDRFSAIDQVRKSSRLEILNIIFHDFIEIVPAQDKILLIKSLNAALKTNDQANSQLFLRLLNQVFDKDYKTPEEALNAEQANEGDLLVLGYTYEDKALRLKMTTQTARLNSVLEAIEKWGGGMSFPVQYTINKIDGERDKFKIEAQYDVKVIEGVRNAEIYWIALKTLESYSK